MLWIELAILLSCIVAGARIGGLGLGAVAGVGLAIFVFGFGMPPGGPPGVVVGMILAVITAVSVLQAAGGLDYLVSVAERILRRRPERITFLAPIVTYLLVFASGTTHVIYALLPIIAEVSRSARIRPERPLSISVIAGFQGVRASPISAATVAMVGFLTGQGVSLGYMLAITMPSTFLAMLVGALSVVWRGRELDRDPEYLARLAAGSVRAVEVREPLSGTALARPRAATLLFLAGIGSVVLIGLVPSLRPAYQVVTAAGIETDQVAMSAAMMIVMIAVAGLTLLVFQPSPEAAITGSIMRGGITAIICIVGLSWLGSSFFEGNRLQIVEGISALVRIHPWTFAIGLFVLSSLLFSAAAAVSILVPVGVALGLPAWQLVVFYPAAAGNFFLPTYGTLVAAVSFDQTGSTRIGRYLLNHSFMRPGLVTMVTAILIAWALSALVPL